MITQVEIERFCREDIPRYRIFEQKLSDLILELIKGENLAIHVLTSRTKSQNSLIGKIQSKAKYKSLTEVTDLCGIRIVTYLNYEIDFIKKLLVDNFEVDNINTVDKRDKEPNEFGYRSFHLVISLNADRVKLAEFKQFEGMKAEVQIRSILQHTWAEIEHDLGYKSDDKVPFALKRGFNALAALLEIAENEFQRLRALKSSYQEDIKIAAASNNRTEAVDINPISLISLLASHPIFVTLRTFLSEKYNLNIGRESIPANVFVKLSYFNFPDIQFMENKINETKSKVLRFAEIMFQSRADEVKGGLLLWAAPLLYFMHYWAAEMGEKALQEYHNHGNLSPLSATIGESHEFMKFYELAQKT